MLNLLSLILGLAACLLPVISVWIAKNFYRRRWNTASISFLLCTVAVLFQLMYQANLAKTGAMADLLDTIGTAALAAQILVGATVVLNIICAVLRHKKED